MTDTFDSPESEVVPQPVKKLAIPSLRISYHLAIIQPLGRSCLPAGTSNDILFQEISTPLSADVVQSLGRFYLPRNTSIDILLSF